MSARPPGADLPRFTVRIGASTYTQAAPGGVVAVEVEEHVELAGVAQVVVSPDHPRWAGIGPGQPVEVTIGGDEVLFSGLITGLRHTRRGGAERLTITAMDPLVRLSTCRRTRTWEEVTDADVVRAVLGSRAGTIDATEAVRAHVLQRNESDLDLLKRLAARSGRLLVARGERIHFLRPQYGGEAVELHDEELEALDVTISPMQVPPTLTVHGWNPMEGEVVEGTATGDDLQRIGSGRVATDAARELWPEGVAVVDVHVTCQAEATEVAAAELGRLARTLVRGTATVVGRPDLRAGGKVRLPDAREGFRAEVFVIAARHLVTPGRGYTTELRFCANTLPT